MFMPNSSDVMARRERLGFTVARPVVKATIPPESERQRNRRLREERTGARDWLYVASSTLTPSALFGEKTWRQILNEVAMSHNISAQDIISERRQRNIVAARHEYIWRLRHETPMSMEAIGRRCGGRDHATVRHAIQAHEARNKPNIPLRSEAIRQSLMFEHEMSEREMIEAMIKEGATTYRIRVECGVGGVKVRRIRQEMKEREAMNAQ